MKKLLAILLAFALGCSNDDRTTLNTVVVTIGNQQKIFEVEGAPYFDENDIYIFFYSGRNLNDPSEEMHFVIPYHQVGENVLREFRFGKPGVYYYFQTTDFMTNVVTKGDNYSGTFEGVVYDMYNNEKMVRGHFLVTQ
jgi:hypothetical protein